jgi:Putative adhesin
MTFMSATDRNPEAPEPPAGAPGPSGALRMTPGRWVALAVAVPVALALIGWTGFTLVASLAQGSYPVNYPIPVHDDQVAVNVNAGNVTLRQGPGSTARLTGTVRYGLVRPGISESTTPAGADIAVNCDGVTDVNCGMNATLDVPARTAVTLSSNGGDIGVSGFSSSLTLSAAGGNLNASNLAGDLRLDTGGGDLTGNGLTGTIQISTEGGNVSVGSLNGPMRLDSGGGDLTGNGLTGNLQVSTEGGNVDGNAVDSQQVSIQSGGGDVTVQFSQPPQNLKITADGGNVTVILPRDGTKYAISTPDTQGGNVSYPSALASSTSQHTITVDSGGGAITISEG